MSDQPFTVGAEQVEIRDDVTGMATFIMATVTTDDFMLHVKTGTQVTMLTMPRDGSLTELWEALASLDAEVPERAYDSTRDM